MRLIIIENWETSMTCIFRLKPYECSVCLESRKLQCILDHPNYIVSEQGVLDLKEQLEVTVKSKNRIKE